MKICLVSPPTLGEFNERVVDEAEASRLIVQYAPLGILSLAAVLRNQGIGVEVIDLNRLYYEYLIGGNKPQVDFCSFAGRHLQAISADVFGFSTICSTYPLTLRLAGVVREAYPEATIILGGPQASVVAEATLESFGFVDQIVRGEAEETLPRLLDALSHGEKGFEQIPGITYRKDGRIIRNANAPVIEDLDQLPLPDFDLLGPARDSSSIPLEAGRGCPFACTFCSTNDFFRRRFRMKSAHALVEQMKLLKRKYDINTFDLIHDMFTVDRKKVVAFCEALAVYGEELYWGCSARTDCIDDELIDLMAQNGCNGIFFGIDSGSDRMQTLMHKRLNLADAAARIKRANRRRVSHTISLIAGFPDETKEDLRATIKFIGNSLHHEYAIIQLHLLAPLAETPITTEYQDLLIYDEIFSDISFQGWAQDSEEQTMIIQHPKLFPNFYAVPTRCLDRQYLREVREFLLHAIAKLKWLLALLHRDSSDLLQVFDDWVGWSNVERKLDGAVDTSRQYYSGDQFPKDFVRFIATQYLPTARYAHLVQTLAAIESAQDDLPGNAKGRNRRPIVIDNVDQIPVVADEARLTVVNADYKRLMRALKQKQRLDSVPCEQVPLGLLRKNGDMKVMRLNDASYDLMKLCDGSHTIKQIAEQFSTRKHLGISPLKASVFGLASLARQGLINIAPSHN